MIYPWQQHVFALKVYVYLHVPNLHNCGRSIDGISNDSGVEDITFTQAEKSWTKWALKIGKCICLLVHHDRQSGGGGGLSSLPWKELISWLEASCACDVEMSFYLKSLLSRLVLYITISEEAVSNKTNDIELCQGNTWQIDFFLFIVRCAVCVWRLLDSWMYVISQPRAKGAENNWQ